MEAVRTIFSRQSAAGSGKLADSASRSSSATRKSAFSLRPVGGHSVAGSSAIPVGPSSSKTFSVKSTNDMGTTSIKGDIAGSPETNSLSSQNPPAALGATVISPQDMRQAPARAFRSANSVSQPKFQAGGSIDGVPSNGYTEYGPESRLHGRIQEVEHERDSYQTLLRDAVTRIFDLEARLKTEEAHPEVELLQEKAIEIYRRSKSTMAAMNADIADLKLLYRTEKNGRDSLRLQLVSSQKELELAKTTLKIQENALNESEMAIRRLSDESYGYQQGLATVQTSLETLKQERSVRMKDTQASTERNLILAQKCEELERRHAETMIKLEEAVEFGEKAVRARDQLALRMRDASSEMSELRDQESKTYTEVTERSKRDIQQLKQASEEIISQLREDVRNLESKLTEKDIELSRSTREAKALQMHIDRTEREALANQRESSTPEDVFRRLAAAERDRDRLALLVQNTQTSLRQKLDEMSQREVRFEKSMKEQNERLKDTVGQCENLNNEHVAMAEEIQRLQAEIGIKDKSLRILNQEIQAEIFAMQENAKLAEADRTAKNAAMEESQKHSLLDMQHVNKLLRQQVAHWQAEFNNLQNTNEVKIRDLKERLSKSRNRQYELEMDLQRQSTLNGEMVTRMEEVKAAMISMSAVH